ncbi:MAG: Lrp/AsnC family transcriptional regulator [Ruminococcus sp.]|nr:Lrp/AsnC family transcriptional regulator [Ruminococcus sp.]
MNNINKKICGLLCENARLSYKELGAMTGISESDAETAVKNLEREGVIRGYTAIINEELLNNNAVKAFIEVKVTPKAEFGFDDIAKTIMMYDEVETLTLMSGAFDLAVTIGGTNYKDVALFVARRLSTIDGVLSTATHFVLKPYKELGFLIQSGETDERGLVAP